MFNQTYIIGLGPNVDFFSFDEIVALVESHKESLLNEPYSGREELKESSEVSIFNLLIIFRLFISIK